MKKIFQFIILIICLQAKAQDKPKVEEKPVKQERPTATTMAPFGKFDTWKRAPTTIVDTNNLVRINLSQVIKLTKPHYVAVEMSGLVTVKTWNETRIKLETSIWIDGNNELTDEKWLERIGLSAKESGDTIKINTKPTEIFLYEGQPNRIMTLSYDYSRNLSETVYYGNGSPMGVVNSNRVTTLYVPSQSKLKIVNKYGQLALTDNIKDILIINTNGEINAKDIDNLELRSSSGRFIAGVIRNGNINISHGRLYLAELSKGKLNTAYNTIEIGKIGTVQFNSATDDMDINESGSITGIKNYGGLQINVSGNLDLEGVNSRIKLRNIAPSAELIRIFDMNTDLRIPIHEPQNYAVDVKGSFINLYSAYSNIMITDTLTSSEVAEIKVKKDTLLNLAKVLSGRNVAEARVGITSSGLTSNPAEIIVEGKPTWSRTEANALQIRKDSLQIRRDSMQVRADQLKARSDIPAGSGAITINSPRITTDTYSTVALTGVTKGGGGGTSGTTITIKDGFSTIRNFRYTFKTGDAAKPTKFEITCTNCTVDFK